MRNKLLIAGALVICLAGLTVLALPRIEFFMLTGRFSPIRRVEYLKDPIDVDGWSRDGLDLADGRTVQLPGFTKLPEKSAALAEVAWRGVEITDDGRVIGLVRVHHWCGNDPVREHIARVDLAYMLTFLAEGEPVRDNIVGERGKLAEGRAFTQFGWRMGEWMGYEDWVTWFIENGENADNAPKPATTETPRKAD